jgi:Chaperone of endosialidase
MVAKVQIYRTANFNAPPGPLAPGELCVEMGVPLRLWVGVPYELDASYRKLLCDPSNWVMRSGDTMTGYLTLHAHPTQPMHAATKGYVDSAIGGIPPNPDVSNFVYRSGDTMTGALSNVHGFYGPVYLSGNANHCLIWDGGNATILRAVGGIYFQSSAGANWGWVAAGGMNIPGNIAAGSLNVSGMSTLSGIDNYGNQINRAYTTTSGQTNNGLLNNNGSVNVNNGDLSISSITDNDCRCWFRDAAGTAKGVLYWDQILDLDPSGHGAMALMNMTAGSGKQIQLQDNGTVRLAGGMRNKDGYSGSYQTSSFNSRWNGTNMGCWVDDIFLGDFQYVSDYRIKKDVVPLGAMWETVKALKPITYTHADYGPKHIAPDKPEFLTDGPSIFVGDDVERWGFIAHELQETLTMSAANGYKDINGEVQSPNPWTVIAALTKALQEAMAEIEALKVHTGMPSARA